MSLKEIFKITRGTRVILTITLSVAIVTLVFARFYYWSLNQSEDPRIAEARKLMIEFDKDGLSMASAESLYLLDSALAIFSRIPGYNESFEKGVIYNNKCSALLLKALYDSIAGADAMRMYLEQAKFFNDLSINNYRGWLDKWGTLDDKEAEQLIRPSMPETDPAFAGLNYERIIRRRIKNIMLARIETPRRLSVAYTNRGTYFRHTGVPDSALYYFDKALLLWEENRVARSNISVLLGGEPVKPTIIESLFPPDRKKSD